MEATAISINVLGVIDEYLSVFSFVKSVLGMKTVNLMDVVIVILLKDEDRSETSSNTEVVENVGSINLSSVGEA